VRDSINTPRSNGVSEGRLPLKTRVAYGFGGFVEQIMSNTFGQLAFPIYNIALGVNVGMIGVLMGITRLTDALTDPLVGVISDNTRSRWGRRVPYIVAGSLLTGIVFAFLFSPPLGLSPGGKALYAGILGVVFFICYGIFAIPYNALGFELTSDYDERTSLQAWRMVFITVKSVLSPWVLKLCFVVGAIFAVPGAPDEAIGARYVTPVLGLMVFLGCLPIAFYCRERETAAAAQPKVRLLPAMKDALRNKPFAIHITMISLVLCGLSIIAPLTLYINNYYIFGGDKNQAATLIGVSGTVSAFAGFLNIPIVNFLSRRFGKKKVLCGGVLFCGVFYQASWFLFTPAMPYLQLVLPLATGLGFACCWMLNPSITADICDYDEFKTGQRREGVYSAIFAFAYKSASSLVVLVSGFMIAWTGFTLELPSQTPETIHRMRLLMMLAPSCFLTAAGLIYLYFPLTRAKVAQIQKINARRKTTRAA